MLTKKFNLTVSGIGGTEIYCYLESPTKNKKEFVKKILRAIPFCDDIAYAGYRDKKALEKFLKWSIYNHVGAVDKWNLVTEKDCITEIEQVITKCQSVLGENKIKIFIFPTLDQFVIKKMDGVSGFSPWKNTILLWVFHTRNFNRALRDTVCHELAHALSLNSHLRETLLDDLVFEGVAEHFREAFFGGGHSVYVRSLSQSKASSILREIKGSLGQRDESLYRELFFGTGKYPLWAGYAVGYLLVKSYLYRKKTKNWSSILKISPQDIFTQFSAK